MTRPNDLRWRTDNGSLLAHLPRPRPRPPRTILQVIYTATLCPAAAIYLSQQSTLSKTLGTLSKAYCSENPFTDEEHGGTKGVIIQFLLIVIISDFWEWGYHRLGHIYPFFWAQHKVRMLFS